MHASHLNMRQVEFDVRALAAELHERRLLDVALVVALHHVICKRRTEGTVKKSSELCGGEQASRELACEVLCVAELGAAGGRARRCVVCAFDAPG